MKLISLSQAELCCISQRMVFLILREMDFTKIQGAKGGGPDGKTTNRRYWLGGNG